MTGETHRAGGAVISVVGFLMLRQHSLLLPDVNEGLQLLVMYPFTMWGSVASDLDHHWDSCPAKDAPSWCINKALHLGTPVRKARDSLINGKKGIGYKLLGILDASHRSWQTHSDLTLLSIIFLLWSVMTTKHGTDLAILSLILTGIGLGVVAHLILDILTPQGIWSCLFVGINKLISLVLHKDVILLPEKIHLVPNIGFFATGGMWETAIRRLLKIAAVLSVVYLMVLMFPDIWQGILDLIPYEIEIT